MRLVLVSFTLIYSCMCIIIPLYETLYNQPFSVTSEASDTQNHLTFSYWVSEHQGTGDFLSVLNCACVIHTNLHTLSAACALVLSSYINVCAGALCSSSHAVWFPRMLHFITPVP